MAAQDDHSPDDGYFNDLSQQLPPGQEASDERRGSQEDQSQVPKPKRIACVLCRKRKLKCDGNKPSCATCTRLAHDCSYDEVRRKSGPKRGYVKALEARLAQVETLLKTQDDPPAQRKNSGLSDGAAPNGIAPEFANIVVGSSSANFVPHPEQSANRMDMPAQTPFPNTTLAGAGNGNPGMPSEEAFPWEMIGLGLDEPLPTADVVSELNQLFFDKIHPSLPVIHRPRYYAAMNLAPHMRPPVCLRYAMWANAAGVSDKYEGLQEHFYQRARKYIQQDEMKGFGETMITIAHVQTWTLLASYEFKVMYFPRAWLSAGRATRMVQMMGLHRVDGAGLDVKQCLPPPKDWTEREERRRTFWMAFSIDRYSSIGTGWPMTIEEKDIMTNLPCDDKSYELSKPCKTLTLEEALEPSGASKLSSFAGVVMMACLFGRNLLHLHRPGPQDKDDDLNGDFWKRHRAMDNILLNTALALPDALRLPAGLNDPNIVFLNMALHTSTICLHQAAIFKADKNRMPSRVSAESKIRCITAAAEVASIMRQICHLDLASMNPFISFCLYVAARVFVQYLKSRPQDAQVRASLQFLLSAMHAIKRKNPLTESFLVQLDVDLEGAGLEDSKSLRAAAQRQGSSTVRFEGCPTQSFYPTATPTSTSEPHKATFGDNGMSKYTDPQSAPDMMPQATSGTQFFGFATSQMSENIPSRTSFELPNRQRTPGSAHVSPESITNNSIEMDTSPDGSHDHHTPNSSTLSHQHNASSRTSNTGASPSGVQVLPDPLQSRGHGIFEFSSNAFSTEFDMNDFAATTTTTTAADAQQSGYAFSQDWSTGSTGLTPVSSTIPSAGGAGGMMSTGMTPGAVNELMGMNDEFWTQMMDSLGSGDVSWAAGQPHDAALTHAMLNGRPV